MPQLAPTRRKRRLFFITGLAGVLWICGCLAEDEVDKATTQFVQATATLSLAYQTLLTNANVVEAKNYIVNQTFAAAEINDFGIKSSAVLTADEIKLRADAIKALSGYTTALATLAAGKSGDQIQADAATASINIKSFTTDLTSVALTVPKGGKAPDFATPAATAAAAMGDVLKLIENQRGAVEIRASIKTYDAKITPLYGAMEAESTFYFVRQKEQMRLVEITVLQKYNAAIAAKPINEVQLLQLSDRLEQYEKDSAALSTSDPTAAINAFERAHVALVNLVTATKQEDKKKLLAVLIAQLNSFAAEVKAPAKGTTGTSTNS